MKLFESIIEACPSSLLQLYVLFSSSNSFSNNQSKLLFFSICISLFSITETLIRIYPLKKNMIKNNNNNNKMKRNHLDN